MNIEVNVRGDPSIPEQTNRYYEQNIVAVLNTLIKREEYPHLTLRFFLVVMQKDKNVPSP